LFLCGDPTPWHRRSSTSLMEYDMTLRLCHQASPGSNINIPPRAFTRLAPSSSSKLLDNIYPSHSSYNAKANQKNK
jgi:hypothetical protein